jgi:hypothetical protein
LRQAASSLRGLTRRPISVGILQALNAPLGNNLAADALCGMNLTHEALIAQSLLR